MMRNTAPWMDLEQKLACWRDPTCWYSHHQPKQYLCWEYRVNKWS